MDSSIRAKVSELLELNASKFVDRLEEALMGIHCLSGVIIAVRSSSPFCAFAARRFLRYCSWLTPWLCLP